ncbi:MAG TPA: L,D-transpeptidase family protein [Chloroflexi bacterium]|nr:L,D-transpeptidase family protein [Chloroflexota bacterium]
MMSRKEKARNLFLQGVTQAKAGQREKAGKSLRQAVALDAENEAAWLYLSGIANNWQEAGEALRRVEKLNPANPHLKKATSWFAKTWPEAGMKEGAGEKESGVKLAATHNAPSTVSKYSFNGAWKIAAAAVMIVFAALAVLMLVKFSFFSNAAVNAAATIVATPTPAPTPTNTLAQDLALMQQQLENAQRAQDQLAALDTLEEMYALSPDDTKISGQLANQYFGRGIALRNKGDFEAAKLVFERALQIKLDFSVAEEERTLAVLYLTGAEFHRQARWRDAAITFDKLRQQNPAYPFVDELLYSSWYNQALVKRSQGDLEEAIQLLEQATQLLPDAPQAEKKLFELSKLLKPPTPTPGPPKRVIVDILDQRVYAYEGDTLVYNFIASTGEPGRDTAIGEFEILNKIPMAYASTWNLDMPNWMGVYWSGSLQNGFHALPTVRHTGYTLWDGFLGQRVSYGCIILSYTDSQILYDWVEIGTPVTIQY